MGKHYHRLPKTFNKPKRIRKSKKDYFRTSRKLVDRERLQARTARLPNTIIFSILTATVIACLMVFCVIPIHLVLKLPSYAPSFPSFTINLNYLMTSIIYAQEHLIQDVTAFHLVSLHVPVIAWQRTAHILLRWLIQWNPFPFLQIVGYRSVITFRDIRQTELAAVYSLGVMLVMWFLYGCAVLYALLRYIVLSSLQYLMHAGITVTVVSTILWKALQQGTVMLGTFAGVGFLLLEDVLYMQTASTIALGEMLIHLMNQADIMLLTVLINSNQLLWRGVVIFLISFLFVFVDIVTIIVFQCIRILSLFGRTVFHAIVYIEQTQSTFLQRTVINMLQLSAFIMYIVLLCLRTGIWLVKEVGLFIWDMFLLLGDFFFFIIKACIDWIINVFLAIRSVLNAIFSAISACIHQFDPVYAFVGSSVAQSMSELFTAMGQTLSAMSETTRGSGQ